MRVMPCSKLDCGRGAIDKRNDINVQHLDKGATLVCVLLSLLSSLKCFVVAVFRLTVYYGDNFLCSFCGGCNLGCNFGCSYDSGWA